MPDTIGKHRNEILKQYHFSQNNINLKSLINLIKGIAKIKNVNYEHQSHAIGKALMRCTETCGKWNTRFVSLKVYNLAKKGKGNKLKIQHEHVIPRKNMAEDIIKNPKKTKSIVQKAIGCIVLSTEHTKLKPFEVIDKNAWIRYKKSGVKIKDKKYMKIIKFN